MLKFYVIKRDFCSQFKLIYINIDIVKTILLTVKIKQIHHLHYNLLITSF